MQFPFLGLGIHQNRNRMLHGGMLMAFVDHAMGQCHAWKQVRYAAARSA
jgi:acyl-coenzyme A thioesterase PaaI-like protein